MDVEFFANGERLEYFDLKQMICHLLAVGTCMLKGEFKTKKADFIYLIYDPTDLEIAPDARDEIIRIYNRTVKECNAVDFPGLYRAILECLRTEYPSVSDRDIDDIVRGFSFKLVSQKQYKEIIANL